MSRFKGINFMTPNIVRYGEKVRSDGTRFYELSSGTGLYDEPIFGLTVRTYSGERFNPDPSKMFHSLEAAETFIREEL